MRYINKCVFLILVFILILSIPSQAASPVVSISTSVSPNVIEAGSSGVLTVRVSETGGLDWMKNPTVGIDSYPAGITFPERVKTVSRIDKSSSNTFSFTFSTKDTMSSGTKEIRVILRYYEMDLFNVETYGPYDKYTSASVVIKPAVGTIAVSSSPTNAEIYLDGSYKGTTPKTISNIQIGSHTVKLTKSGYNDISKAVTVSSGQTAYVSETLYAQKGAISISSSPSGASIYLDGTYKGTAPTVLSSIPVGSHTIKLTKSGYNDISKTVTVSAGQTAYVSKTLDTQKGSISVSSNPSGANVYLDGTYQGTTTKILSNIPIGSHTIKITKSGYEDKTKTVTVSEKPIQISETLTQVVEDYAVYDAVAEDTPAREETRGSMQDSSNNDNTLVPIGFVLLLFVGIVFIAASRRKKSTKSKTNTSSDTSKSTQPSVEETPVTTTSPTETPVNKEILAVKSAFQYKGATIQYKVKIINETSEPVSDIKTQLFVPDVFMLEEKEKTISMLEPNESKTVTFDIRPTGECGDCSVSGRINYYDYETKKRQELDIEKKMVSIVCPVLKRKDIDENEWRNSTDELIKAEENTKDLEIPAENLFNITTRVLKDMNMFMLKPEIIETTKLFTGVGMFYAEGAAGLKYAAYIEVVGSNKSRLILRVWAEKEEALTGFYHRILDEIEKRIDVKIFIDDNIVQHYNIHYGDKIGTQVKDSVVQRSNIGADTKRKCPDCGKEAGDNEKFCNECGVKLE